MKRITLFILLFLQYTFNYAQDKKEIFVSAANSNITYIGRFDATNKEAPVFMYSGSEISTSFTGTLMQLHLKDDSLKNWFTVNLDDSLFIFPSNNLGGIYMLANNLKDKIHTVSISRRTEWSAGNTVFLGFTIEAGKQLLPVKKRSRSIEFIGDSYTCGYGNEGKDRKERFNYSTENNYLSYGAIVARKLDANYIGICRSGIGMYQAYGGDTNFTQPKRYDEVVAGSMAKWDYKKNMPQLVVIDLGTNDLSVALDSSKFVNNYIAFVHKIRQQYPVAKIVCVAGPASAGDKLVRFKNLIKAVTNHYKNKDKQVYHFAYKPIVFNGSDSHPNIKEHEQLASELLPYIKQLMKW